MHKPGHDEPQSVDMLRKLGYESSDVSLGVLVKWIGGLFVFIGGTSLITWAIYLVFVPPSPVVPQSGATTGKLPPGVPALQSHPKIDMRKFREDEEARVNGYGWVDRNRGIAHIPVNEELDNIAASGALPKAEPGAGAVAPARGEDVRGVVPNTITPASGAGQAPAPTEGALAPGSRARGNERPRP